MSTFIPAIAAAAFLASNAAAAGTVRHEIAARISPASAELEATDRVTFPSPAAEYTFSLHEGLSPEAEDGRLERLDAATAAHYGINSSGPARAAAYRLTLRKPAEEVELRYSGRISHPLREQAQEYARSFSETPGIISEDGCYLSGASYWYPRFGDGMVTFALETSLPEPYDSVAPGTRASRKTKKGRVITSWEAATPHDDITLTCGKYSEYASDDGDRDYYAFLLSPDKPLAARYLDATASYVKFYSDLIGPYPYDKFALAENFWDTGYGMPSFTLLGSNVIRLPFIINTSYPHEILHNWWGNGVFVDYPSGNWCEGLTVYLADYLIAENRGKALGYRMTALQKYSDYVAGGRDFPLTEFRSRHSSASEAVGYGKAMMMYHMLRNMLGDKAFLEALRRFYADNRFRTASFSHLRTAFEQGTGAGRLVPFFRQWTEREGAPKLELRDVKVTRGPDGYDLEFTLAQTQEAPPYSLEVPAAIYIEGVKTPRMKKLQLSGREETYHYSVPVLPQRVEIDPEFDVFRRLSPLETPPTLSRLLGAESPALIIPSGKAGKPWKVVAAAWTKDRSNLPGITVDSSLPGPPLSDSYWVLGKENRFAEAFEGALAAYGAGFTPDSVILDGRRFARAGHTFVFAAYGEHDGTGAKALILSGNPDKLPLLARKLPHYGKYSWLVFDSGMNSVATGIWPVTSSPLTAVFSQAATSGGYPAREPLAVLPSDFSAERLRVDLRTLASMPGGRAPGSKGHRKAAGFIAGEFKKAGLKPFPGDSFIARSPLKKSNVIGAVRGLKRPGEYVVLCAHYDHLPEKNGAVYPGADDNASGIAVLLELARRYAAAPPDRSVIFAAFDGEEDGRIGSKAFVKSLPGLIKSNINAAVNFDTVGRLNSGRILALGTGSSDKWVHILRGASFVSGHDHRPAGDLDASDQLSFIEAGIPGIQLFSGAHSDYHKPTDTAARIDFRGMVRVAEFSKEIIDYLAGSSDPITRPGAKGSPRAAAGGTRKVSTGLVPDFSFAGEGVKAQDITPGSPLDKAGLVGGDVIVGIAGMPVKDLRDYSEALKKMSPGRKVKITYISGGSQVGAEIEPVAR